MTGKEFLRAVSNGRTDILEVLLDILREARASYCVIGGLSVNAYAEPVVSLDCDLVVVAKDLAKVRRAAMAKGMRVREFEHSVNLSLPDSDLRIQLQTDGRYQEFIPRASRRTVLGYKMTVAALDDVLRGKIWAYSDESRRRSKRQKDLADILRLIETHPRLKDRLPPGLVKAL
ncbi:MAG: hypothetical protein NTV79_10885 [Candidatus Aureabacteria bacterium]|nr:hypothetical protein [Candidatus Auribacterota bacterium]